MRTSRDLQTKTKYKSNSVNSNITLFEGHLGEVSLETAHTEDKKYGNRRKESPKTRRKSDLNQTKYKIMSVV